LKYTQLSITVPSSPIFSSLGKEPSLETEVLFGEKVSLLEKRNDALFIKTEIDNYYGWINNKHVGELKKPTHRVLTLRTIIFTKPDIKSNSINYLPMGSQIYVKYFENNWACIMLSDDNKINEGFISKNHIVYITNKSKDWVKYAEQLIGVPYKWGGRDTIGLDCSALVQLSLQTAGIFAPRNTDEQINMNFNIINNIKELRRGSIIFWKGHVGILTDNNTLLHANAFSMNVVKEPLLEAINRIYKDYSNIKKMFLIELN